MKKTDIELIKHCALEKLKNLRTGDRCYADSMESIEITLEFAGLTLADIGTSKEELERCRVLGCKTGAQAWLSVLRKGTNRPGEFLVSLEEDLRLGNLTYADIGTTIEEVTSFGKPLRPPLPQTLALYWV